MGDLKKDGLKQNYRKYNLSDSWVDIWMTVPSLQ
jgi:hypothetical protein